MLALELGNANSFFVFAAAISARAATARVFMNTLRELRRVSHAALRWRLVSFVLLLSVVISAVLYTQILMK